MPELTIAERLLYSTVKLTASIGGVNISTGTGFFTYLAQNGNAIAPAIVTNKHVINGADQITAICHLSNNRKPSGRFVECKIFLHNSFINHPDPNIDLCAILIGDIMNQAEEANTPIFLQFLDKNIIPSDDDWQYFDAIEEVVMIGCPRGISDEVNNLPIARRGITASPLSNKYNGKNEFMVDMACFPGSSGSPVFIYDRNGYLDRRTQQYNIGKQRINFVGILYAGPLIANNGEIILAQSPCVSINSMMHLGNVIRSSEIRAIETEFQQYFPYSPPQPATTIGSIVEANGNISGSK